MDRSRVLTLIRQTYQTDEIGQRVPVEEKKDVFCSVASVSGSEWFEAGRQGIKPEIKVSMFCHEYQGEKIAELDGVRYSIYRTYQAKHETIELYLEKKAGV